MSFTDVAEMPVYQLQQCIKSISTKMLSKFSSCQHIHFLFEKQPRLLSLIRIFCIQLGGAAMFNLSLLTADIWAVVFRFFFYQQQVFSSATLSYTFFFLEQLKSSFIHFFKMAQSKASLTRWCPLMQVDWLYFLAFAIVVFGLIIYSTKFALMPIMFNPVFSISLIV